jgi:S-formylglutathione hydrolase FrmB
MQTNGARHAGVSLLAGWLPLTLQLVAGVALVSSVVWLARRGHRRRLVGLLPAVALAAILAVAATWWCLRGQELDSDPPPIAMWLWIGLTGAAAAMIVLGWRWIGWRRRSLSVLAAGLTLLGFGIQVNYWVGYFPTLSEAWGQLTAGPMPDQIDPARLDALRGTSMNTGKLVAIATPDDVSHFTHRSEYVYLPPAWFATDRPTLPALMMIGGEFSTPTDWIRTGNAIATVDRYAQAHQGLAPVLVFADSTGSFRNDTECVDGPRGHAAEHLTRELRPYIISHFGTAASARQWGVVGWSTGGTCAVDLGVTHPELFATFEDIQGDLGPNAGNTQQTIASLYAGNAQTWATFDPMTVMAHHTPYVDSAGWFDNAPAGNKPITSHPRTNKNATTAPGGLAGYGRRPDPAPASMQGQQAAEAATLCTEATSKNIACTLHTQPGKHTWQFASTAFAEALPWLSGCLSASPATPTAVPAAGAALSKLSPSGGVTS